MTRRSYEIRDIKKAAMAPQSKRHWFLRRVWLDGTWKDFLALRKQLALTGKPYRQTFWDAACSQYFNHIDMADEKRQCAVLEKLEKLDPEKELMKEEKKVEQRYEYDESTSYHDSVKWAFENWSRFVKITGDGENHLKNAHQMRTEAPSLGAVGLIEYARQSLDKFQAMASRVLAKGDHSDQGEEETKERVVDKGVGDLKNILNSMKKED